IVLQIKDIALKVSGSSHKGKTCLGGGGEEEEEGRSKRISEGVLPWQQQQQQHGSSSSTTTTTTTPRRFRPPRVPNTAANDGMMTAVEEEEEEEGGGGGKEWMAQVEPGVQITFLSLPRGGNDLKRIRFSREMFNKWEAQRWWGENYDRIMELYNVHRFNHQALNTPGRSEDGRDSSYSARMVEESPRMTPRYYNNNRELPPSHHHHQGGGGGGGGGGGKVGGEEPSRTTTTSSVDDAASVSVSNASEVEMEWIEEDEPGVYITIRQLVDGTRELRRVRF
ncbi:hypothetical protein M569_17479, partial [Genlisea aurea]